MTGYEFETRQIHAGARVDERFGSRITPIHQTAGYVFGSFEDAAGRFSGAVQEAVYSRSENPTNRVVERRIADLEGGLDAILTASGQAAITAVVFGLASAGDRILITDRLYEGTKVLFHSTIARQGIAFDVVAHDADDDELAAAITPQTRALYTETLPNPKNEVADLARLARVAHGAGIPLVVDNTVATPYLCRPIEFGADVVIHSTSKWLAGHGAVIGGAIVDAGRFDWVGSTERFPQLAQPPRPGAPSFLDAYGDAALTQFLRRCTVNDLGPTFPALSAFLLLNGIETLSVRMERHVSNAQAVAEWLEGQPCVSAVDYPGLASNRYHGLARRYLPRGAGSIVSFDLAGGRAQAQRFIDALELVSHMTHIGDVRTLALHTGSTIHGRLTEQERLAIGITPGLIRLSVGLEHADDIIRDLDRALAASA